MVRDEIVAGGVGIAALQLVLVGKGDGMDEKVELAPASSELGENGVDRGEILDVAGQDAGRSRALAASGSTRFRSASP